GGSLIVMDCHAIGSRSVDGARLFVADASPRVPRFPTDGPSRCDPGPAYERVRPTGAARRSEDQCLLALHVSRQAHQAMLVEDPAQFRELDLLLLTGMICDQPFECSRPLHPLGIVFRHLLE